MTDEPQSLIQLDYGSLQASAKQECQARIDLALETAALIARVSNDEENEQAHQALSMCKEVLSDIEKARKQAKEPLLKLCRRIDNLSKTLKADMEAEVQRIGEKAGNYQQAVLARQRAAEAARLEELSEKERELQERLAQAETIEEREALREEAAELERAAPPAPIQASRPKGQVVREDWDIQVMDPWKLGRFYPQCVTITPRISEIKTLLDAGINPPGVVAERKVRVGVRRVKA